MKHLLLLFSILLFVGSCSDEVESIKTENENSEYVTVNISMGGEILDIAEEPMTKTLTKNDLTGVQIYYINERGERIPHAWGLFDDVSDMSVKLQKGYEYLIEAASVINGKNIIFKIEDFNYGTPFSLLTPGVWDPASAYNAMNISSTTYFSELISSYCDIKSEGDELNLHAYSMADKFYGQESIIAQEGATIELNMGRVSFGLQIMPDNLNGGALIVEAERMPNIFINDGESFDEIFTIPIDLGFNFWEMEDYEQSNTLNFYYQSPTGEKTLLDSERITFRRNKKTVITVNIPEDAPQEENNSALKLTIEDGEMEEAYQYEITR